jgi:hypothetical protein
VQRVTKSLGAQSLQLPKIGVDLENIAAALTEAQRTGATSISTLESQLEQLDNEIGQAVELEKAGHLSAADQSSLNALINALEQQAIDDTKSALGQLESERNGYSDYLQKSLATLRADGYDPKPLEPVDAGGKPEQVQIPPPNTNPEEVKRWWNSLSQDQRDQLVAQHPPELGNLNGIDTISRDKVNQAVMNDDIGRVESTAAQNHVPNEQVI